MCETEGADGLSLINTIQAMAIDIRERRGVFDRAYAGLSGPAIKPIALRMVHQVARSVSIPVVGIGGISGAEDILEFIMAGAAPYRSEPTTSSTCAQAIPWPKN